MRRPRRLGMGLALALAALAIPACSGVPAAVRQVRVSIRYSHFSPARLEVPRGSVVRFVVTNSDPIDHEFILGDAALQQREETGTDTVHDGAVPGMISVPAGSTVATVVSFRGTAAAGGTLIYACHLPGHYAYGMRGTLRIGHRTCEHFGCPRRISFATSRRPPEYPRAPRRLSLRRRPR
jgi:uncharacterized cupredoxin-like copper-binding protein